MREIHSCVLTMQTVLFTVKSSFNTFVARTCIAYTTYVLHWPNIPSDAPH